MRLRFQCGKHGNYVQHLLCYSSCQPGLRHTVLQMQLGPLMSIYQQPLQVIYLVLEYSRKTRSATDRWELCVHDWQLLPVFLVVILKAEDFWCRLFWIQWPSKTRWCWTIRLHTTQYNLMWNLYCGKHENSIKKYKTLLSYTRMWHNMISPKTDRKCPSAAASMHPFNFVFPWFHLSN